MEGGADAAAAPRTHIRATAMAVPPADHADASSTQKAPLSLIRCYARGVCSAPKAMVESRIRAPPVGTRDAMIYWPKAPPRVCLLVKKWQDADARDACEEVAHWLQSRYGVRCIVYQDDGERCPVRAGFERLHSSDLPAPPPLEEWLKARCSGDSPTAASSAAGASGSAPVGTADSDCTGGGERVDAPSASPVASAEWERLQARHLHARSQLDAAEVVLALGGDGTVLHTSSLFPRAMPPVIAVAFGSLGFM